MTLLIIALYPFVCLLEAWLETAIIDLKDPKLPNYEALNRKEHALSLLLAVVLCAVFIMIAIIGAYYALIPALLACRRIFFDYGLKVMRGRDLWAYEGNGSIDGFMSRLFGENGAWKEFIILLVVTLLSLIFCFS